MTGDNSFLTIKSFDDYTTFFFMNGENSVYEYYIYLPKCENKNYEILNSVNDNNTEDLGKISDLFNIKTNKYYFEIKNIPNEFGYFTLNNNKINGKILIGDENYILSFKVTKDISVNPPIIVKYAVSVEEEEAYSTECQITFNFKECYHSCEKCSKDISESSVEEHNCISCINNYYQSPENNNNCFSIEEKK